jgi:hypothetical protein
LLGPSTARKTRFDDICLPRRGRVILFLHATPTRGRQPNVSQNIICSSAFT